MREVAGACPLSSVFGPLPRSSEQPPGLLRMLRAIRCHLCMDVGFVSEFRGASRTFIHVDADGPAKISTGDSMPLEQGYCQRVVDGRLPELIADTSVLPEALALPDTSGVPIGSHLSVPIRLSDGRVYG